MATLAERIYTPEEYLALERASEHRNEYVNGRIHAMVGASRWHSEIVFNLANALGSRIRGRPCHAYVNDMRVKVSSTGLYAYPDVVALCGELRLEDDHVDTLLNPQVVIEVLSDSTERYDRGEKFAHYRRLESLCEYVLVAQEKMRVERFVRRGDQWVLTELDDPDALLPLESLACEIPLREIYERVDFPA